jgi:hypothetical protein
MYETSPLGFETSKDTQYKAQIFIYGCGCQSNKLSLLSKA